MVSASSTHAFLFAFPLLISTLGNKSLVCPRSAPRGMRPTDLLCLVCDFRVAINEQSDMTTACKFQYFQFFWPLSLPNSYLSCATLLLSVLSAAGYATHWFLVFGMWLSGGYQRHSGMTTERKFQYLKFVCLLSLPISWLWFQVFFLGAQVCDPLMIVFGMWISGGYQRTLRHDYRA